MNNYGIRFHFHAEMYCHSSTKSEVQQLKTELLPSSWQHSKLGCVEIFHRKPVTGYDYFVKLLFPRQEIHFYIQQSDLINLLINDSYSSKFKL